MIIISIDIGFTNLGLTASKVDNNFKLIEIFYINLINISEYTHNHISEEDCQLYHTKNVYDYCVHIAQENEELFKSADYVLIERQPPSGLCHVEQILFGIFRDKVILISPNSVHKFHQFHGLDYDQRKVASHILAQKYIIEYGSEEMLYQFEDFSRQHDIADALGQIVFWLSQKAIGLKIEEEIVEDFKKDPKIEMEMKEMNDFFEKFRFKK